MSIMNMFKKTDKIRPETLLQLARVFLDTSAEFTYISGTQPFLMSFADQKYYVYIKNVSSAYFENRGDTTRAQLPVKSEFDSIKQSPYPFIFLGYDADNDVMICWNYHVAKKRLNAASSVSFYSRTYFQEEVKQGEFLRKTLKNGDTPVLFKRRDIVEFFIRINTFFIDDTNPNYLQYKENINYQKAFEKYIIFKGLSESTSYKYSKALEGRVSDGISTHITKETINVFYYSKVQLLESWLEKLFNTSEFNELDTTGKNMYSCALEKYIQFHTELGTGLCTIESLLHNTYGINEDSVKSDSCKIDDRPVELDGKLLRITDAELIETIMPIVETGRNLSAAQIVGKYYDGKYPSMKLTDWMNLVKRLTTNGQSDSSKPIVNKSNSEGKKKKQFILRVTLPDGEVIEERVVAKTLVKVVEYAGVQKVQDMGIMINNVNLVSNVIVPTYSRSQKYVGDDLYVMTCSDTDAKQRIIEQISDVLGLNLSVAKVPI